LPLATPQPLEQLLASLVVSYAMQHQNIALFQSH
jgi:hypothetical protein